MGRHHANAAKTTIAGAAAARPPPYGRPPHIVEGDPPEGLRPGGLVFDATGLTDREQLHALYAFFHRFVPRWAGAAARW